MATKGSLNSVTITAGDGNAHKTRYLTFEWSCKSTSTGKTTISWEVWGYGGNTANSTFSISLDGQVIASANNETISYKSSTPLWSGEKTYTHDNNGDATVNVNITVSKIWDVINSNTQSKSWSLDKNYPYIRCTAPTSVFLSPAIQKPDGEITISWEGAGPGGTSNPITGYRVWYGIKAENAPAENITWSKPYNTTNTSINITLPSSVDRGSQIVASVRTIGKVIGYDSIDAYNLESNYGRVNILPDKPTASVDKTLVPSNGATVKFELTAGGTKDIGQTPSLLYATSPDGKKEPCEADFSPYVSKTTTYYFWTSDGLEPSLDYVSIDITVNTKPTVTLSIENGEAKFENGEDDQSGNNTYTFGFTYNNQDYTLSSNQTGTTYSIGDMRKQLSDKLGGLIDNTTHYYKFWVCRNDGIENSEKAISDEYSLSIPKFTLENEFNKEAPFSEQVIVKLSDKTGYSTVSFPNAITNGLTLNTIDVDYGTKIDKLLVNGSFYVIPQTTLHKVYEIDIVPSSGKTSPFSLSTFKTYTTQQLGISLAGRTTAAYGLTVPPNLILKYGNTILQTIPNSSTDPNTYIYYADGSKIYPKINTGSSSIKLTLELQNQFGDSFERPFTLQLDHTEPAIPYNNIDLYPGLVGSNEKYPLNEWEYLKEGMPIYTDFSVLAFDEPIFIFEIYNYHNSGTWDTIPTSFSGEKAITDLTEYGGVRFNKSPSRYYVTEKLIKTIDEITQDHNVQFRMRIKTIGQEAIYNFFEGTSLKVKAHYEPKAYFTKVNFADSDLETEWVVEDYGGGNITDIGLGIQEYTTNIQKVPYEEDGNYTWEDFKGFSNNEESYDFLHISPVLYSSLSAIVKKQGIVTTTAFETTKESAENLIYTIIYNIAPTVSYRRNCLGINTNNPLKNEAGVLVVNSSTARDKIYFTSPEHQSVLSLTNGGLSGFIMDCGSWSNIPGGIISDVNIPSGLAQIAYTGQIYDLLQEETYEVILDAGSAPTE